MQTILGNGVNTVSRKNLKEEFDKKGFVIIENFFESKALDAFEQTLAHFYRMLAAKIGKPTKYSKPFDVVSDVLTRLEENDLEALIQIQKFFASHMELQSILYPFKDVLPLYMNSDPKLTLLEGPVVIPNRPSTTRLLYRWHSEEHYYPKRRTFLNLWFPLFVDKSKKNGTMSFKVGSHLRNYPFAEYAGYDENSKDNKRYFNQKEIPESFLTDFNEFWCDVKRGDLVVFHSNLVHCGNENSSERYSYAGVARIWDPTNDLTLTGTFNTMPYNGTDKGRPGLVVKP